MDNDLCFTPAVELARLLRSRELSARELLDAFLSRIHRVNPRLNAIVTLAEERAVAAATAADAAAAGGGVLGVLHGLPIAVKDLADTAGIRTTYGSPLFASHVPDTDAPHVLLLKAAGAVIIGKTNTPEFGAGSQTFNTVFGVTRNPWDVRMTPGGSSGGAAAAVAAGLLPFADGSDLAASVRNPAAMCSLVGLRTTPGLIPSGGDFFDPLPVLGPIARSAADAALLLAGLRGHDPSLPFTRPGPAAAAGPAMRVAGLRVAWSTDLGGLPVEPEVAVVLARAREVLAAAGAVIADAEPDLADADEVFLVLRAIRMASRFGSLLETARDQLKDTLIGNIEQGLALTGPRVAVALRQHSEIFGRMRAFLGGCDVLAAPTVQVAPFPVEQEWVTVINGIPQDSYIDWLRTCSRITVTGHPAISVPAGFTAGGLPVGLQLVGRYGSDDQLLSVAGAVAQVLLPEPVRPPEVQDCRLFTLRAVAQPLPGQLADAVAFVLLAQQPGLVQVGRSQQAVREQEPDEIPGVAAFRPDEALQQLLVVGHRALSAQVQGDDHVEHRHRLRCAQPEDKLLVVVRQRQPRRRVALEVTAHPGYRVFPGRARRLPPPGDRDAHGDDFLATVRLVRGDAGPGRQVESQPQDPGGDAHRPQAPFEHNRPCLIAFRGGRQHVPGRAPDILGAGRCLPCVGRQVNLVSRVTAEQFPAVLDVAQARAARGAVQGRVPVIAECGPVQPGDLVRRATQPLAACR
jgi:amidase